MEQIGLCRAVLWASQMAVGLKNLPANAGDIGTWVQSLGQEETLEESDNPLQYSCLERIPWKEESIGSQRVGHD